MIKIEDNPDRIIVTLVANHSTMLLSNVKSRLNKKSCKLAGYLKEWIEPRINEILTASPKRLLELNNEFYQENKAKKNLKNINTSLSDVFNYSWFSKKSRLQNIGNKYCTYILAEKLNVNVCPYCNCQRTFTIYKDSGTAVTRPEFDHYFSQVDFPLLALSFYNLIPSCHICNSTLKGDDEFTLETHCHPYIDEFGENCKFIYNPKSYDSALGLNSSISIKMKLEKGIDADLEKKITGNRRTFALDTIYREYKNEVAEIIFKCNEGDDDYINSLKRTFPKIGNGEDLYRVAFGNYLKKENFEKRPLAKLTKDIVDQLEIRFD